MATVLFGGNPTPLAGKEVKVGDKAPDFSVVAKDLSEKHLSDFDGKIKILSIYPSIDTSVCATQNRKFNEAASSLKDDVVILSISMDLPFAQGRFCAAEGLEKVITLSDHRLADFGLKYGFLIEPLRLLARGTVVVDKDNVVRYVEYVHEVTTEPNYEAALSVAKSL
ncbi:thiol peroxidase [Microbacter margulisiae]|uniref:Thiol peroxidase n=1 Tax=Microbacter margulisiae TaxID=1350067 RepID=A0A7W5DNA7_9PORP|nr:thiol peroxidase [Microbacter margulisiae]MBB3186085.1 thiol peroxidase [Microbacter margulisiae]